jgi:hypothetical protein
MPFITQGKTNLKYTLKDRVFKFGLICFLIGITISVLVFPIARTAEVEVFSSFLLLIFASLTIFGLILLLVGLFFKVRSALMKTAIILLILFILWGVGQTLFPELFTSPFEKLALKTKNELPCTIMPIFYTSPRYLCYSKVAFLKNDITICEKIKDEFYHDWCYEDIAKVTGDASICEKVSHYGQNSCYLTMAEEKKDVSLCEKIKDEYIREGCRKSAIQK